MNILFVCEYYHPHIGGVEVVFKNLVEGMVSRGHRCRVLTCRLPGTPEKEDVNGVGVYRLKVPYRGARYWFGLLSVFWAFRLAGWADIVHTTTYGAAIPAFIAARLRRKRCVITIHEFWGKRWRELSGAGFLVAGAHRLVENIMVRLPFNARIAVSNYTRDCLEKAGIGGAKVIHNGIDKGFFKSGIEADRVKLGLPPDAFIYTYYGRPGMSKGVENLIKAVPEINRRLPGAVLLLILSHDPPSGYRRVLDLINQTGIRENVILLEPVPFASLPEYIAASDCIVIPSLSEGFGFAAAEACATGRPVVASDTGSLPEVVWGDCVLVKPGDPVAIAAGVEMVSKGRVLPIPPKAFDWSDCVEKYLATYKEVISGG